MKKELQRVMNANLRMEDDPVKKRNKIKMSRKGQNFRVVEQYSAGKLISGRKQKNRSKSKKYQYV